MPLSHACAWRKSHRMKDQPHAAFLRGSMLPTATALRFLAFPAPARCLQSPRGACRLRSSVAAPPVAGCVLCGSLATRILRNEAESSPIALRRAGSPRRASPWGWLLSAPVWLHVGHLFDMGITFQITRKARLGLTHQISRIEEDFGVSSVERLHGKYDRNPSTLRLTLKVSAI